MDNRNANKPGYKKTKAGWIPQTWDCVPFGRIVKTSQYGLNTPSTADGTIPIIGMSQLSDGKISSVFDNGKVKITQNEFEEYRIITDLSLKLIAKSRISW